MDTNDLREVIKDLINELKYGDSGQAYHNLIELDSAALPLIQQAFEEETDIEVKATLIEIIWQHRDVHTLPFLEQTLTSNDAPIWKAAIDGLVAYECLDSLAALKEALSRTEDAVKAEWIQEALDQIKDRIKD